MDNQIVSEFNRQKRRTRNDVIDRDYTCGCGKTYLSYPALYTHLKQKHEGKPPEGTLLPSTNGKAARGRPKKEESQKESSIDQIQNQQGIIMNDDFYEFEYFFGNINRNLGPEFMINYIMKSDSEKYDIIENFPVYLFDSEDDYAQILNNLRIINSQINPTINIKIDQIFSIFLKQISQKFNIQCFREMVYFTFLWRKLLNQNNKEYTQNYNGQQLPDKCNEIIEFLQQYQYSDKIKDFQLIGKSNQQILNTVYLVQIFCSWLYLNQFTDSKIILFLENESQKNVDQI